jgi:ubiquinone/menaquinone biosynthesis C-methylase UbiE
VSRSSADIARAYDRSAAAWHDGPARLVYGRLAEVLVGRASVPLADRLVLDVGAGTGAASRSLVRLGAAPVPVDLSASMLRSNPIGAVRAVVADATRLPVAASSVDGVVAAFSFNHLPDPAAGFAEARRVARPGAPVLVSSYAAEDNHPVKEAVDTALAEAGWRPEGWYRELRTGAVPQLATVAGMAAAAEAGGLSGRVEVVDVPFPELTPEHLVAWRLGLAQAAPFVATLTPEARSAVVRRSLDLLGPTSPPLERSIVAFTAC